MGKVQVRAYCLKTKLTTSILWCLLLVFPLASSANDGPYRSVVNISRFLNDNKNIIRKTELSNEVSVEPIHGLYLQELSAKIAANLRKVSNEELGITALQEIYDSLKFEPVTKDDTTRVNELTERLQMKLKKHIAVLNKSRAAIEEMYWRHSPRPSSAAFPCCDVIKANNIYNEPFGAKTVKSYKCNLAPEPGQFRLDPKTNLTEVFSSNLKSHPTITWQYFLSSNDLRSKSFSHLFDQTCKQYDNIRHRDVYFSTVQPFSKNVILIMDHGKSLSNNQFTLAKAIGKQIVSSLTLQDKLTVIALADYISFPNNIDCVGTMPSATQESKFLFTRFIDGLNKSEGTTNHSLGFKHSFQFIQNTLSLVGTKKVIIIYISRGLLSSLEEGKMVLETIAQGYHKVRCEVIINTCALIDDGKPIMTEKQFLTDISDQNFEKYDIPAPDNLHRGVMLFVNNTASLTHVVSRLFSVLNATVKQDTTFSLPSWDAFGKGIVVSMSQPCFYLDRTVGVVGMDIQLSDIVEDITYFNNYGTTYAFMLNKNGITLMHPSFPRPSLASEQPMPADISYLENIPDVKYLRELILNNSTGSMKVVLKKKSPNTSEVELLQYTWQHLADTPHIIVIASVNKGRPLLTLQKVPLPSRPTNLVYHRLDLLSMPAKMNLCRHLRQLATYETGVLFLSASCFQYPYEHLIHEDISQLTVKNYMAYINDHTRLLANPGLKPSIRNDVAAIVQVLPHWKTQFNESPLSKYIVRSYAATPSGVFQMYPGSVLHHKFDPTRRSWYTRALEFPGRVVLTAPYLDVGGAGYIVTLSHTVYEGKAAELHSASDTIMAVLGLDFTIGFFYKILLDTMPFCDEENVKCFILDDKGYLIAHPSLIDPNGNAEQQHITHKEPLVANDLLSHPGFVTKILCNSFPDHTSQRFYQFNVSLSSVLTNLVHGEHCIKYQIAAVPGTNAFVGVVNSTCELITAFCPCSVTDRLCLNCNRMEQAECECPCECPLDIDMCSGNLSFKEASNPCCTAFSEPSRPHVFGDNALVDNSVPLCFEHNCESYVTQSECFGVLGCEWCQRDSDTDSLLETPFCTHQYKCFNGVYGSVTPYGDSILERSAPDSNGNYKTTPVGPVAGGMVGCILLVGIIVYCYRHIGRRNSMHAYMRSTPETAVRMSTLDNEMDDLDEIDDMHSQDKPDSNNDNVLLHRQELLSALSPYRVSTNYPPDLVTGHCRPAGCDSDHGYSTMTPYDDSEHLPCAEPLLLGKEFQLLSPSQHVNPSSPTASPLHLSLLSSSPPQTEVGHQVLAPVTVHMVDTL